MLSSEPTRASVLSQSSNAAVRHDVTQQLTGNGGAPLPITGISALQNENNTPVQQRLHIETHQQHKSKFFLIITFEFRYRRDIF